MGGTLDIHEIDASYRPFPEFGEWLSLNAGGARYDRALARLNELKHGADSERMRQAARFIAQAAAVQTGAIEQLYECDRGFTLSVARMGYLVQAQREEKGEAVASLIEAQIAAYDGLLDLATQSRPVVEATIPGLHERLCAGQRTYSATTEVGRQEIALPLGRYKVLANHVQRSDGSVHAYAPVDNVVHEVRRLCEVLESPEFTGAHPVLQAAYAHYALVWIHPFADGNGRVARALASLFLLRACSCVLLVWADQRHSYLDALEAADSGHPQRFVDFVRDASIATFELFGESLTSGDAPVIADAAEGLSRLYVTASGLTHDAIDQAAHRLFQAVRDGLREAFARAAEASRAAIEVVYNPAPNFGPQSGYRVPVKTGDRSGSFVLRSKPPADASIACGYWVEIPLNCGVDDNLAVRFEFGGEPLEISLRELEPVLSAHAILRIKMRCDAVIGRLVSTLAERAQEALRQSGRG